ncbi:MAG: MFS transporter [Acidobacteriaceae bacterium]|nr:MFS transporter [Acidobacteriaceae bacterium]
MTIGAAVGIPYYNLPFFYDYFQKTFHWSLEEITLGFPLAAICTVWIGPLLVPRFSQRKLIVFGAGLTALCLFGFGVMGGSLPLYFALYFLYTAGYIFSGPIPHQILVSHWFEKKRGRAMGLVYVGVGLFGGGGSFLVRYVTAHYGYRTALFALAAVVLIVWPLAIGLLRDTPAEMGQFPDGRTQLTADAARAPRSYGYLVRSRAFWLLLVGSVCSIGAIGSINIHMKFVFRDAGYTDQLALNAAWTTASVLILWSSIAGRLSIGWMADWLSKKAVMTGTYFVVALTILLLLAVRPAQPWTLDIFGIVFGFSMGADYFLIPLMAAEEFGVNTLARAMAILLPVNTIGQTWCPYLVAALREHFGNYLAPMAVVFAIAMAGALAIALLPRRNLREDAAVSFAETASRG